jgi:hypothetical protein
MKHGNSAFNSSSLSQVACFLGIMAPLHLAHLNSLVPRNSLRRLQNLDGVLLIGKIFSSIQVFQGYLLFRHA